MEVTGITRARTPSPLRPADRATSRHGGGGGGSPGNRIRAAHQISEGALILSWSAPAIQNHTDHIRRFLTSAYAATSDLRGLTLEFYSVTGVIDVDDHGRASPFCGMSPINLLVKNRRAPAATSAIWKVLSSAKNRLN